MYSEYNEVLILPFSSFSLINIEFERYLEFEYYKIELEYLEKDCKNKFKISSSTFFKLLFFNK